MPCAERRWLVSAHLDEVLGLVSGGRHACLDEGNLIVSDAVEIVDEAIDLTIHDVGLPLNTGSLFSRPRTQALESQVEKAVCECGQVDSGLRPRC